jgi:hypothetical protein
VSPEEVDDVFGARGTASQVSGIGTTASNDGEIAKG